jgi:DNA-binding NarL/FixJ family response regulator
VTPLSEASRAHEPALMAVIREGHSVHEALTSLCRSSRLGVWFRSDVDSALDGLRDRGAPPIVLVEATLRVQADGLGLCRALRSAYASTWLILATPAEAVDLRVEAFRIGVHDCVSASLDARELEALLAGRLEQLERTSGAYEVGRVAPARDDALAARAQALASEFELGFRETQILAMLAGGLNPKEIGPRLGCSYATVRTNLRRVSRTLACSETRELILLFFSGQWLPNRRSATSPHGPR